MVVVEGIEVVVEVPPLFYLRNRYGPNGCLDTVGGFTEVSARYLSPDYNDAS